MKKKKLLLVDYENKQNVDLSLLDESYRAIIFVGAQQNPPRASKNPDTARRFSRVEFVRISGNGKNALDFHIAFVLGRTFETARDTECFVLSGDKGFDPLLHYLNSEGMACLRVESIAELVCVCPHCKKTSTIEHHGGRWCSNCGRFAAPPDPKQLPSNQPDFQQVPNRPLNPFRGLIAAEQAQLGLPVCAWCNKQAETTSGIYDDGEWMCGHCVG